VAAWASEGFFQLPVGENSGFSRGSQKGFPGGPKVSKFDFTHSKPIKQPFFAKFNRKMSHFKIQGDLPFANAHVRGYITE